MRVDPAGEHGPTPGQARGPSWRPTTHGFHVPAHVSDEVPEQRILEEAVRLPEGGAVTGWAALRLAGAAYFDGLERDGRTRRPVPLVVPAASKLRSLSGSTVGREPLPPGGVVTRQGIPIVSVVRALFDEMRAQVDRREAVVAMDMAAAAELVSIAEMGRFHEAHRGWRRARAVLWALGLADECSLSPGETRMRLIWELDARLPRPLVNQPVWDHSGHLLGVADLFDPAAGVVGEYDGGTHRRPGRHTSDVHREDLFRRAGLEYVKVTAMDLSDPRRVVERMQTTRARSPLLAGRRGTWTLQAPPGWRVAETAEDRLARRDWLRELEAGA